ncbi:cyclase family protein [Halomarina rubra]|uniref:Cyclase family protein n=1 Tax=Halomarina rubra TaxID=2071873 RepID=A0ABD6AXF5_9EURY|nr:cyclase family protein [Halomarina rubra]
MFSFANVTPVDLSIGIEPDAVSEPWPAQVEYFDHEAGADLLASNLAAAGVDGVEGEDFPDGQGLAWEEVTAIPHTGTHLDAPWHYGPEVDGEPAKTVDEVPLEWCCGDAVVLDFTWKEVGGEITLEEIDEQLAALDHELSAGELVFIETGADDLWGTPEYLSAFPGMGAAATKHLVEQGIKVVGTDAYGFDKPFAEMGRRWADGEDESELWPAHFAGREVEYCQIEKMANLNALPRRTNVPVVTFPVVVEGASAGWVRPVAFVEDEDGSTADADHANDATGGA